MGMRTASAAAAPVANDDGSPQTCAHGLESPSSRDTGYHAPSGKG